MKNCVAKFVRNITAPPVLALVMLLVLQQSFGNQFANIPVLIGTVIFLSVLPACAYPVAAWKRNPNEDLRERQRKFAFIFTLCGYTAALVFGKIANCGQMLLAILCSYFIAVLLLTFLNRALHMRASGHACSCVLPYLFLIFYFGIKAVIPCILLYTAEFWASVALKRHTVQEFLLGSATAAVAYICIWETMLRK